MPLLATSTPEVTTASTTAENPLRQTEYAMGATIQLITGEEIIVRDAKNPNRAYRVLPAEFMDSRCPKDAVCIWAGERAVRLEVTDLSTRKLEDLRLGMITAQSGDVMGLHCTLLGIGDATSTYADIKFE